VAPQRVVAAGLAKHDVDVIYLVIYLVWPHQDRKLE